MKRNNSEVVVVGAGLAGVCAAVSAARLGARVTLIEREPVAGGTTTGLRHQYLCGLFINSKGMPKHYLNPGLPQEIGGRLSPRIRPLRMGKVWLLPFAHDRLMSVLTNLLTREKNIKVLYSSRVIACVHKDGQIQSVQVACGKKPFQVKAEVFIDAGTGVLLKECGAVQCFEASKRQLSGFACELGDIPWDDVLPVRVPYVLYQAVMQGALPLWSRWTSVSRLGHQGVHLKFSLPAESRLSLAKALCGKVLKVLRRELPAFQEARIMWRAGDVFSRDGDLLRGKYILLDQDVTTGKKFPDAVIKGAWPMECWDPARGPVYQYPESAYYEMPLRCLQAKGVVNLLAAGRCVSATPMAHASLRVGGLCMATGEAAGRAAVAILSKKG
ncbi:MAG: FAD-dependent oxidoreductase [Candidatus Omnitrophota bacterium]